MHVHEVAHPERHLEILVRGKVGQHHVLNRIGLLTNGSRVEITPQTSTLIRIVEDIVLVKNRATEA